MRRAEAAFADREASAGQALHNTFDVEQTMMSMIRRGDTQALAEWIAGAPAVRGGVRSRPINAIREEAQALARAGFRELVLTGIHLTSYGRDLEGRPTLAQAVEAACQAEGVMRVRLGSLEPRVATDAFASALKALPQVCPQFHLALQSGSDSVLRRMNRRGDMEQTRAFLKKAREMGFTLRTTFITGFPGETDRQFERLMDFVRDIRFDRLGAFTYSVEEDTPAASMPNQVPEEVKKARLDTLMTAQQAISLERNLLRVGREERVLVESVNAKGVAEARSAAEAPETDGCIRLSGACEGDIGRFGKARITAAEPYDLIGEML